MEDYCDERRVLNDVGLWLGVNVSDYYLLAKKEANK